METHEVLDDYSSASSPTYGARSSTGTVMELSLYTGPSKTVSFKINAVTLSQLDNIYPILGYSNRSGLIRDMIEALILAVRALLNHRYIDLGVPNEPLEIKVTVRYGCTAAEVGIKQVPLYSGFVKTNILEPYIIEYKECRERRGGTN